jgi:serine phosphatase RsbU (regulator of sigma subunit)
LTLSNAGHLAPYRNGIELATEAALPLGITVDAEFPEQTLQLVAGDLLTLVTDGVPEATQHRELFGFERTAALSTQPAHVIANTAIGFGQTDDITVLSVAFQA